MRFKLLFALGFVAICTIFVVAQQRVTPIQPTGSLNHVNIDNLPADANKGAARTTPPIPSGCEATTAFIANNQMGVLRCNPADLSLYVGATAGAFAADSGSFGVGGTGAAVPAKAAYLASKSSGGGGGNLTGMITCDQYVSLRSPSLNQVLVAATPGLLVYICGYSITGESTMPSDVNLRRTSNGDCNTGAVDVTAPITVGTGTAGGMIGGKAIAPGIWAGMKTNAGDYLCSHRSAAVASELEVWYAVF